MLSRLVGLFRNSLIYSLSGFAGMFISVFLVPVFTRIFTPDQYGIIDLIATIVALLNLTLILGLDSAVGRYYADTEDDRDRRLTASTGLFYLVCFSSTVVLVLILISKQISSLVFDDPSYSTLVSIALATLPFAVVFSSCQNLLRFRFQPIGFALVSMGLLLLQISLIIYFVVFLRAGIFGIYAGSLVAFAIFSAIGLWLTRSSYALVFSYTRLKELLYFGTPLVPLSLAHYVMTYSDRYFLRYFSGLNEVGLYGVGYRLASVMGLVVFGFQSAWGPFVYSAYREEGAREMFSRIYDYASIAVCFGILFLSLFAREILAVFTTQDYLEAYKVVPFIAASIVAYTFGGYFSVGIGIAKKNIHRAWAGGVAAMVNLGLNYLFIPPLGMVGAALATILSFLLLGCILMNISQRYYYVQYRFRANFAMYTAAAILVFIGVKFLPGVGTVWDMVLKVCLLAGFLLVPFLLKLVGSREMLYLRNTLTSAIARSTR